MAVFTGDLSLQRIILTAGTDALGALKTSFGQLLFRLESGAASLKKDEDAKTAAAFAAETELKNLELRLRAAEEKSLTIEAARAAATAGLKI